MSETEARQQLGQRAVVNALGQADYRVSGAEKASGG